MIIDAHVHLWDPSDGHFAWMADPAFERMRRRFGPEDLLPALTAAGVGSAVVVQARHDLHETRDLLKSAAQHDRIAGVVGWVDLCSPAVDEQLEQLLNGPAGDRLVGIRHPVCDEPPGWLLQPAVARGLNAVSGRGLAFDLLVEADMWADAVEVARRLPGTRFVLDHLGFPEWTDPGDRWLDMMRALEGLPNVWCKVSGIPVVSPLMAGVHAIEMLGPDRCIAGSDWPLSLLVGDGDYTDVWGRLEPLLAGLSLAERDAVTSGAASAAYLLRGSVHDQPHPERSPL